MRARFLEAEPAPAGWPPMRVMQPRLPRSRAAARRLRLGSAGSAVLHLLLLAALLFQRGSDLHQQEAAAPSFAVQFVDAGQPAPSTAHAPEPRVNPFGQDMPPPPPTEEDQGEPLEEAPPLFHYGTALHPKRSSNPFAHVVPFDLTQHGQTSVATRSNGRSLDLSLGPVVRDGRVADAVKHTRGNNGFFDWEEQLREFVEEHKYYPREAAENGEQGSAVLRVTVARDGTVKRLMLVSSSGSQLLDAAWMAVFRDNRLPPFNDDISENEITFNYELDYSLIYGH